VLSLLWVDFLYSRVFGLGCLSFRSFLAVVPACSGVFTLQHMYPTCRLIYVLSLQHYHYNLVAGRTECFCNVSCKRSTPNEHAGSANICNFSPRPTTFSRPICSNLHVSTTPRLFIAQSWIASSWSARTGWQPPCLCLGRNHKLALWAPQCSRL
jgi:hypothetical protein